MSQFNISNIDQLFNIKYQSVKAGTFRPVFVIGIGGTGCRVLRCLKDRLRSSGSKRVELLGIDTDDTENTKHNELPQLDRPNELVLLNPDVAVHALDRAKMGAQTSTHILDWCPARIEGDYDNHGTIKVKVATGKGAGQYRRAGRLMFAANVGADGAQLQDILRERRTRLVALTQVQDKLHDGVAYENRVQIFVVSSLSGGTGAGMVLDMLALLRSVFPEPAHEVTVINVLPGEALDRLLRFKPEKPQTRANTVALLTEMQAIRTGALKPARFQFEGINPIEITEALSFANGVILVDNALETGNPLSDYMELCRGIGTFLYCFTGTGMGADVASGQVNVDTSGSVMRQAAIYGTFGVGFIEIPAFQLFKFTALTKLYQWVSAWLSAATDAEEIRSVNKRVMQATGLDEVQQFKQKIAQAAESPNYRIGADTQQNLLKKYDDEFFLEMRRRRSRFESDLKEVVAAYEAAAPTLVRTMVAELDTEISGALKVGLNRVENIIDQVQARLKSLAQSISDVGEENKRRLVELHEAQGEESRNSATGLAKLIYRRNIPVVYDDTKHRLAFVKNQEDICERKQTEAALPVAALIITGVARALADRRSQIAQARIDLEAALQRIDDELRDLRKLSGPKELGSWCFRADEFPAIAQGWLGGISGNPEIDGSDLRAQTILQTAFECFRGPILAKVEACSLRQLVHDNEKVRDRVKALIRLSAPLMNWAPGKPADGNLMPLTVIGGDFPGNDAAAVVQTLLPDLTGAKAIVNTSNPHLLIVITLRRGFAALNWQGFEDAYRNYQENPEKCHVLATWRDLPPLKDMGTAEQDAPLNLALGLLSETIVKSGPNYYLNFVSAEERFRYSMFSDKRGELAAALIEHGVMLEATQSETDKGPAIGNSVGAALAAFRTPRFATAVQQIRELVEERAVAVVGTAQLCGIIDRWLDTILIPEAKRAVDERKKLLQKMVDKLKAFSDSLRANV